MKDNKKKFILSEELRRIFAACYKNANDSKMKLIPVESFLYHTFYYYFNDREHNKNLALVKFFGELSGDTKEKILDAIEGELKNLSGILQNPFSELDEFYVPNLTSMSSDLSDIINAAADFTREHLPERINVVETDVVFAQTIACKNGFTDFLGLQGITSDKVLSAIMEIRNKEKGQVSSLVETAMNMLKDLGGKTAENNNNNSDNMEDDEKEFEKYGDTSPLTGSELDPNSDTPYLDQFSVDMCKFAKEGRYDPVIGRDEVVESIIEVLCKRKKSNVALVGDAGCGKSSIVELLSQKIISGNVPEKLKGKRICSLNLNDLVAGTKYRGEYEERLQKIIKEVCSHRDVIVYIDELHGLVGNGGSAGNGDGANILKPYLARGEFQCIGSTTNEEYRKFIEKDAALNRRFTQIEVVTPNAEETVKILLGIQASYEKFHHVRVGKDVIEACVEWAGRYITDKNFPDKAIDILDLSGSIVSLRNVEANLENPELQAKLQDIIDRKIKACTEDFDFELGEKLKAEEAAIQKQIEAEKKAKTKEVNNRKNWPEVSIADIATAISKVSRVPVDKISQSDNERLALMKKEMCKRVIGQDQAINELVQLIQRNYLGLRDPKRPIGNILFVGPSGVGKTYVCKQLAEIFFGSDKSLIRIDGGMLKEAGAVNTLIGAPPSFIGHDEEPLLLQVKRHPNSVVLFDEIEKANPGIYDILLNIMDEGSATLNTGEKVDFSNTIIILTGNIGTRELKAAGNGIGFGVLGDAEKQKKNEAIVKKAIEKTFKVEFINRLSGTVVFNELGKAQLSNIFNLELDEVKKKLNKKKFSIKVSKEMKEHIIELCDKNFGARDLKRNIDKLVIDPVGAMMLEDPTATKFLVNYDKATGSHSVIIENKKAAVKEKEAVVE